MDNPHDFIPDFSGDDFANDPEIIKARKERRLYQQMVGECISIMKNALSLDDASHKNLKSFLSFKSLSATILDSFKSLNTLLPLYVCTAEYRSSYSAGKAHDSGTDQYIFGLLNLQKTYPRTLICKETLGEKIAELIVKKELDFPEQKRFSRKFYVLSEDRDKLFDMLCSKPLDELSEFPDMEAEIRGNLCLFRTSRKSISIEEAHVFCGLANCLNGLLN